MMQTSERALDMVHAVLSAREAVVGCTPKHLVWRKNKASLFRYASHPTHRTPVFIVVPLINRSFILDLRPGNSFVEYLVQQGFDVFLLDWGTPGDEDRDLDLSALVTRYLTRAVRHAAQASNARTLTVLGYCIGGTLSACYAALYPETVKNLVLFTTPIDFADAGTFGALTQRGLYPIEQLTEALPLIPGELPDLAAKLLNPLPNTIGTYMRLWNRLGDAGFDLEAWQAMYRWVNEGVPFPSAAYRQWITEFYQLNKLARGQFRIENRHVELGNIRCPVLNVSATADQIAPPPTTRGTLAMVGSEDVEDLVIEGGHVGIVVGRSARNELWPRVAEWLAAHD